MGSLIDFSESELKDMAAEVVKGLKAGDSKARVKVALSLQEALGGLCARPNGYREAKAAIEIFEGEFEGLDGEPKCHESTWRWAVQMARNGAGGTVQDAGQDRCTRQD
jgi:hypothetical protein